MKQVLVRDIPAIRGDTLERMESVKSQRKMSRKGSSKKQPEKSEKLPGGKEG